MANGLRQQTLPGAIRSAKVEDDRFTAGLSLPVVPAGKAPKTALDLLVYGHFIQLRLPRDKPGERLKPSVDLFEAKKETYRPVVELSGNAKSTAMVRPARHRSSAKGDI